MPSQHKGLSKAHQTSPQDSSEDGNAAEKKKEGNENEDSVLLPAGEAVGGANQEESRSGFPTGTEGFAPNGYVSNGNELIVSG